MSVNMFKLRFTTDCQPRTSNGQPAHSTTGVPKRSWSQFAVCAPSTWWSPVMCPPISSASTGKVSTVPIQKRRVKSASSGLGRLSAVTSTGSRAIPQIGQEPGPTCLI